MKRIKTVLVASGILFIGMAAFAQNTVTFTSLVSFNQTNGAQPQAGLVQGSDGNYYGTTAQGGANGDGTIFQLTPSGLFTNLVSFGGTNGANPRASLLSGSDGGLYGTTYTGGTNNAGVLFRATTNGSLAALFTFSYAGGGFPIADVIQDQAGNLYGTTALGGTNAGGTAFEFSTNQAYTPLASFDFAGYGGNSPYAGLLQGPAGSLYGTTYQGGTNGDGTIYRIDTNGTLTMVASFAGTNGANPYAGLICGQDGAFYGTTYYGGSNQNYGTIFKFDTNGNLTTLVSFANTNGAYPQASLIQGLDGSFYGTTAAGGIYTNQSGLGYGIVFRLQTNGTFTPLIMFNGTNGGSPQGPLIQDPAGNIYGTTASGGSNGYGTVFRFSINPAPILLNVVVTSPAVQLSWNAAANDTYQVLYKTNLNQAVWNNLSGPLTATNATMMLLDPAGPDQQRFYQVQLLP